MNSKRISFLITLVVILVVTTSCYNDLSGFSNLSAKSFLKENYNDTFELKGEVEIPQKYSNSYRADWKFRKYFAKNLNKEIIIAVSPKKYLWDEMEYASNYLFVKYEDKIEAAVLEIVLKDFGKAKVSYDVNWIFADSSDSSDMAECITSHYETRYADIDISLEVTEEENASFEERLHSLVYSLWKYGAVGRKYINAKFPDGSSKNFFVKVNTATVEEM